MTQPETVEIRIVGENLPGSSFEETRQLRVGIQKGEVVEQDVSVDVESAVFHASLCVKAQAPDGKPVFSGPYIFGPSTGKFLYLSWGERNGGEWNRIGRAKLPLARLEWETIHRSIDKGQPVELIVNLTNEKGGPACATLNDRHMRWL